ncbi:MAG: ParB/RepB/Spo0J family partition protein [Archaeoglobaceae archaeon]
MRRVATFKEPVKGSMLTLAIFSIDDLQIPPVQRDISSSLVRSLEMSIDKMGFLVPVLVVKKDCKYYVVDGQHRLEALKGLGVLEVPGIIVDESLYHSILDFNTEKPPTIREKSKQAYRLYKDFLNEIPDAKETELISYFKEAMMITFGFILEEYETRFPVGFYENFVSKIDNFLDMPLSEAQEERRNRAEALIDLNQVVNEKYAELGWDNSLLKGEIINKAVHKVYGGRVRVINDNFYEAIEKVKKACQSVSLEDIEN